MKVFAHNQTLKRLFLQYKHANFDECIRLGHHLINSRRQGLNRIGWFNGFPITDYLTDSSCAEAAQQAMRVVNLCEKESDFDDATFDPLFCGLVVALIVDRDQT